MCDRDTIQFVMVTVWMFTFVGASRGYLCDRTAFLWWTSTRIYCMYIRFKKGSYARAVRYMLVSNVKLCRWGSNSTGSI